MRTDPIRAAIDRLYRADETECVRALVATLDVTEAERERIQACARRLVTAYTQPRP